MMALLEFHPIESPPLPSQALAYLLAANSKQPSPSQLQLPLATPTLPPSTDQNITTQSYHINILKYSWSWRSSLASLRSFIQFPLFEIFWNRASKSNRTKSKHVKLELTWNPCSDQRIENGTLWYMGGVRVCKQGGCKSGIPLKQIDWKSD